MAKKLLQDTSRRKSARELSRMASANEENCRATGQAAAKKVVLVGTYRAGQLERWPGYYNYPLAAGDAVDAGAAKRVDEIWLFNGTRDGRYFAAEFVGTFTRAELVRDFGYPAKGAAHGEKYLLYRIQPADAPANTPDALAAEVERVIVRAADFAKRSPKIARAIKAYLESPDRNDPGLKGRLPAILLQVPRAALRVCEPGFQSDFFDELMPAVAKALSSDGGKFRLATVFSGIGAIEQALLRTHVDHEIVFACDNGDQTPFVCGAVEWQACVEAFKKLSQGVDGLVVTSESQRWAAEMIRRQRDTIQALLNGAPSMSKRPERELKDRVQMLHEALGFYKFRVNWEAEGDWLKRKRLVDMLYRPLLPRNKVRQSYLANYPLSEDRFHWNVTFLEGKPYRNQVDLFVGGSPCQSFSLVGKQMGLSDTRGTLFYEYARLVSEIRPKCFIYENVRALLSNDGGRTWETMSKVFTDLGYDWKHQVLNAKDYGIPQNRERVFVVGFRKDLGVGDRFEFPRPKKLETTMQDFLLDVVPGKYYLPERGVRFVLDEGNLTKRYTQVDGNVQLCQKKNQQFNWHGDFVFVDEDTARTLGMPELEKYFLSEKVRKYVLATGTKTFYSRPKTDLAIARPLLTSMHKMHRAGVDNYITRDGRIRKLAPRECLRLMGFSDTFKIVVPDTSMYQQAGNAIVVDVLVSILESIRKSVPDMFAKEVEDEG